MSQEDVVKSLEGSAKLGLKAALEDVIADGKALDLEVQEALAAGQYQGLLASAAAPFIKQVLSQIAAKLG